VDPEQDILAEIKETQPVKAWLAQLQRGLNVATRVRAVRHLGTVKEDRDLVVEELIVALKKEPFWRVQQEILHALGNLEGVKAKEALLVTSENSDPRLRRTCIDELAKFKPETEVANRFRTILEKGDPSYAVELATLRAFAGVPAKDSVKLFSSWLDKPALGNALCLAAIAGLGRTEDKAAFAPLLANAQRGKPRTVRMTALGALGRMAKAGWSAPEEKRLVVAALTDCLDDEGVGAKRIAITALGELGKTAATALPALNRVAEKDPDAAIKAQAKSTAEKIKKEVEKAAVDAKKAA
jgi:HEAT repeat protein